MAWSISCAWWFFVAVGELGAGSKAMKKCSKLLTLKEVAAGQRPRQQLRVVREFWRGELQLSTFGAGVSASPPPPPPPTQWTMACAVLKGAERKYRCTGLEMAPFQRCRISCSTSSPEARNATSTCPISLKARSLSRHTHTTCHCCPASMGQHPVCKSRPLPLPCRLSPSMPLLLPPEPAATAPYRMKND